MSDHEIPTNPPVADPTWSWGDLPEDPRETVPEPTSAEAFEPGGVDAVQDEDTPTADADTTGADGTRYKPRTCRICFEEVLPTFDFPSTTTEFLGGKPRVRYVSEDFGGRLMRPCKCSTSNWVCEFAQHNLC